MLPILIRLNSNENVSVDTQNKITALVQKVMEKGGDLDALGFVLLVEDTGRATRGNCSIPGYLRSINNISKYALTKGEWGSGEQKYKKHLYSLILLGINMKSIASDDSCWSYEQLRDQMHNLLVEEVPTMVGSGVIGLGQYCLADKNCYPISTGENGKDYGLVYASNLPSNSVWTDVVDWKADMVQEVNFKMIQTAYQHFGLQSLITGGQMFGGSESGQQPISLYGPSLFNTQFTPPQSGISTSGAGLSFNLVQSLFSDGIEWKNPYTREWFDACGRYYNEGEGKTMLQFNEEDIPRGQQGNYCDPSRLMELYKRYKCR